MGSGYSHEQYCNVGLVGQGLCPKEHTPDDPIMVPASYQAGQGAYNAFDSSENHYNWEGEISPLHF